MREAGESQQLLLVFLHVVNVANAVSMRPLGMQGPSRDGGAHGGEGRRQGQESESESGSG